MDEFIVRIIWDELKRYINNVDRPEAADILVSALVENDYDINEIREAFKGDSDIKRAITDYLDQGHDESEEEDEGYEEDEDWDN